MNSLYMCMSFCVPSPENVASAEVYYIPHAKQVLITVQFCATVTVTLTIKVFIDLWKLVSCICIERNTFFVVRNIVLYM